MTTTTGKQTLHASHGRNRVRRQPKDVAFDVVLYLICACIPCGLSSSLPFPTRRPWRAGTSGSCR